ncbi:MAG: c-type cytochrome [Vulcanococcus sp.]
MATAVRMVHLKRIPRQPAHPRQAPLLALIRGIVVLGLVLAWWTPAPVRADGAQLFSQHCAGCHVNGGNIIRRGKTLKLAALERQGLDSSEAIARIAASGIGQMSGYAEQLGAQGVDQVAEWVWQQAQLGWPKAG